nr:long-chain fatty acid transport protein-like [Nerophis lumbriciformis]
MHRRAQQISRIVSLATLVLLAGGPAYGAGFSIYEQGSKAMGMAGAFTGQADDGSAMFHNIAGIGFIKEREIQGGTTLISLGSSEFTGLDPFPGAGVREEQDSLLFYPAHAYLVQPINERWTFGFSFNSPFGLTTRWANKDQFTGRFISLRGELRVVDLTAGLGWQVSDTLSIGAGVGLRVSDVELLRRVPVVNPFTQTTIDGASVLLDSDIEHGLTYHFGFLHRIGQQLSWGLTYHGKTEIDYGGSARFEQYFSGNPVFDAVVASRIPFDQDLPLATSVEFPDQAVLGVSVGLTQRLRMNADIGWTGWSTFDEIVLDFVDNPEFSSVIPEEYEDVYFYRFGFNWQSSANVAWRFGYVIDESPQPDTSVGPLLPDADRDGITLGLGWKNFDFALMYLKFDDRTTTVNDNNFNGTYETTGWLLGLTMTL